MPRKRIIRAVPKIFSKTTITTKAGAASTAGTTNRKRKADDTLPELIKHKKHKKRKGAINEELIVEGADTATQSIPDPRLIPGVVTVSTTSRLVRSFGTPHRIGDFHLGTIFSAPTHEELFTDLAVETNSNQITTTRYGKVYTKLRKHVVVARYANHMTCLPIYTHNNTGLRNKDNRGEYVGIRDKQYYPGNDSDSPHGTIYTLTFGRRDKYHPSVINDKSYVQFTRPTFFLYSTNCILESKLPDEDLRSLILLVNSRKPEYGAPPASRDPPARRRRH